MRTICLALAIFASISLAGQAATTLTVSPDGTKGYTTIAAAYAAAVDGDTIEVYAGTYTEAVTFTKSNLTLKAAPDQDVTISGPTGTVSLRITNCAGLTVKGASSAKPLRIVSDGGNALKGALSSCPNLLVEDVEFSGTIASGGYAVTVGASNGEPVTFNRCTFEASGGSQTVRIEGKCAATFNDCDWACEGALYAVCFAGSDPGFAKLNRCNVLGHNNDNANYFMSTRPALCFQGAGPGTIEATDCHFGYYFQVYSDDLLSANAPNNIVRLINPTFGPESVGRAIRSLKGVNCIIQGTSPTAKLDLTQMNARFAFAEIGNGTVTFQDCIMHNSEWQDEAISILPSTDNKIVNIDRCLFPADGAIRTDGDSAGAGETTINIKNSIIRPLPATDAQIINTSMGSKETINFTHCTLYSGQDASTGDMMTASTNDVLNASYSIFDGLGKNSINHDIKLTGTKNIVRNATSFNFGGSAPTQPADTIVADPKLDDLTGHLLTGSPAFDAATGSTETIDYDGDSRPAGLSSDIGADEIKAAVNSVHRYWNLY